MPRPKAEMDDSNDGTETEPINREPGMATLVSSFITKDEHYDRNHGPIQHKNAAHHTVTVDGMVQRPLALSVAALTSDFPQHTVVCTLQCAGNRRHTMRTRIKEVQGVDWFDAAIMNVSFGGPRLRDVLLAAGVVDSNDKKEPVRSGKTVNGGNGYLTKPQKHIQFANYGSKTQQDEWYGGSIPFERAMDPEMDVILAVKMNGEPLSCRHGFPVRAVVPGVLGARSVKWLDRVTVSDKESPCFYQQHDYKILPPEVTDAESAEKYWARLPSMLEMPVNACVAVPESESTIELPSSGMIDVKGYAVPQGGHGPVVCVQVSGDEGASWVPAEIDDGGKQASKWTWVLWHMKLKMNRGKGQRIFAKATDAGGNTQTDQHSTWNLRGVGYNGYEAVYNLTIV